MNRTYIKAPILSAIYLVFGIFCYAEPSSETNKFLSKFLKNHPKSDINGDGILSIEEARSYRVNLGRNKAAVKSHTESGKPNAKGEALRGYNGLYMGHSFFKPVALDLIKIIPDTNILKHTQTPVMQGGQGGSPGHLWKNSTNRIKGQKVLDSGEINLLAMTYFSPQDSSVEDYSRWFDYALSKNPKTTLLITMPWAKAPHASGAKSMAEASAATDRIFKTLIPKLRMKYPNNTILFCPHGFAMYSLLDLHKAGNLPGVKYVLNPDFNKRSESRRTKDQLVYDETGHGGELVTKLSALLWLQTLYDINLEGIRTQTVEGLPKINLNDIALGLKNVIDSYNSDAKSK